MKRKLFIVILAFSCILMSCTSDISSKNVENQAESNIQVEDSKIAVNEYLEDLKIAVNEYLEDQNNRQALKTIKKFDKDQVISELSKIILEATQDKYSAQLSTFVTIRKCKNLYEQAFDESCPELDKNSELAEQLSDLYNEQENLGSLYPFNLEDGATGYQLGDVYVTNRIEDKDAETIMGRINQMVNSHNANQWKYYDSKDDSYWAANNVEHNGFWGDFPGEESYVILTNQTSPFSKAGVYTIAYYSDGRTITTIDDRGFEAETPVLYLINENQLLADWDTYKESKSKSENLLVEIAKLNGLKGDSLDKSGEPQNIENEVTVTDSKSEYILPDSNSRYLTEADLQGLDQATLRLARNEIYARHGRAYETKDLNEYFSQQSWYHGYLSASEFDNSVLNDYERANVELIRSIENSMSENEKIENTPYSIAVEDIFPSDSTQITSWHSYSTGYYMIPEAIDGEPVILFSIENNIINASLVYGVLIDSIEQNERGGLVCIGRMYPYTKSFGSGREEDYNGTVEVTWNSWEAIDFPYISMIDGHQMTDFSMIADDYCYSGFIE